MRRRYRRCPGVTSHLAGFPGWSARYRSGHEDPGDRRGWSHRAVLDLCGADWDRAVPVADRPGHDRRYWLDDSLLRGMGYRPRTSFAAAATIRWYRDNRLWWEPLKRITGEWSSPAAEAAGGPSG